MSEAEYRVESTAEEVACFDPGGRRHAVSWDELESVRVVTTGSGPFAADVFWALEGAGAKCIVPMGAAGERALLERLQRLPGFDNEALIAAMSSTDDASFTCWRREAAGDAPEKAARWSVAEKLALVTTAFALLHHTDHVLRFDHSGWPFKPEVTPFTYSLLVYPIIALLLALRRWPRTRVALALVLFLVPTLAHLFLETPLDQLKTWAREPAVNLLHVASPALGAAAVAVSLLLSAFALATLIAFWREAAAARNPRH